MLKTSNINAFQSIIQFSMSKNIQHEDDDLLDINDEQFVISDNDEDLISPEN